MLQFNHKQIIPTGNKVLCRIIKDKKIGLVELPDVMQHSGDTPDRSLYSKADQERLSKEVRFTYLDSDIAMTVELVSKGFDVKYDLEVGDKFPIKRDYIGDKAAVFKDGEDSFIVFPATDEFLLGFIKEGD